MFKSLFAIFSLLFVATFEYDLKSDLRERPVSLNMTTSVIVPCHYKHFDKLKDLFRSYCHQTVIPDEVVVSLSEYDRVSQSQITELNEAIWPFRLKIVKSLKKISAGQNRNIACLHCSGDLIIAQDADDLPHPQRVELIKHLFDTYDLDHLLHQYIFIPRGQEIPQNPQIYSHVDLASLVCDPTTLDEAIQLGGGNLGNISVTNGNVAVTRKVIENVRWPVDFIRTEDVRFNRAVYNKFPNRALLRIPLLYYRQYLSTDQKSIMKYGL